MLQERIKSFYPSVVLPEFFQEQNRGFDVCCTPELKLADESSTDSWKNDVTSAWIKLSADTDSATFSLTYFDDTPLVTYVPTVEAFPNEENAYYTTVHWRDVLTDEGAGCYKLSIVYDIGGYTGTLVWGVYNLQVYSIENALGTARLNVRFNLNQSIEGINFTGANVQDTIRFRGQIRKDQPNSEYQTLIYGSRRDETVVNENLPTWRMETDPYTDEVLRKLERLYLLSANEIFISDYNAHTNSFRILDTEVMVAKSAEREQPDKYSRQDILTCVFGLRVKNERTYY